MKIIPIVQPQRGTVQRIALEEQSALSLTFELSSVETLQEGNDLLFIFTDGSIVLIEDFFIANIAPTFLLANGEVLQTFEDILAFSAKSEVIIEETTVVDTAENGISDALVLNVASGAGNANGGGSGEYNDAVGTVINSITRLGLGDQSSIDTGGILPPFLPDTGMSGGVAQERPILPPGPAGVGSVPDWSSFPSTGMTTPNTMFPGLIVGIVPGQTPVSIVLTLGQFCFTGGDSIFFGGVELDLSATGSPTSSVTLGTITFDFDSAGNTLTIVNADGSPLTQAQINQILDEFTFMNPAIGSDSSFDTGHRDVTISIEGANGGLIETIGPGNVIPGDNPISADLDYREYVSVAVSGGDIAGNAKDRFVEGTAGDDSITLGDSTTGGKDNLIIGEGGNDIIQGALNDQNLILGDGAWAGGCVVNPASSVAGLDSITGGNRDDVMIGGGERDTLTGLAGNDILVGGALAPEKLAGLQSILQFISGSGDLATLDATQKAALKDFFAAINRDVAGNVIGDAIGDSFFGGSGVDLIIGNAGNDTFSTGAGNDLVYAGGGADLINNQIMDGNDTFILNGTPPAGTTVTGGLHEDSITSIGTGERVNIEGIVSNSTIDLNLGGNIVNITGDVAGTSVINLGAGLDSVYIQGNLTGESIINAGADDDTVRILGNMSNGVINADAGDDLIHIEGDLSNGVINAEAGNDGIDVLGTMSGGTINAGIGTDAIQIGIHADDIVGGAVGVNKNVLVGGVIDAGAENDLVFIHGNMAGGTIIGGLGDDRIQIHGDMTGGFIDATQGSDSVTISGALGGGEIDFGVDNNAKNTLIVDKGITGNATVDMGAGDDTVILGVHLQDTVGTPTLPTDNPNILTDGTISLGSGNDSILAHGNMTGGTITGGLGDDAVDIHGDISGGKINTDGGIDKITIHGGMEGGTIDTGDDADTVRIFGNMTGGTITTGAGNDSVIIDGLVTATGQDTTQISIATGAGADEVIIGSITGGSVDTGSEDDKVTVGVINGTTNVIAGGSITLGTGNDALTVNGNVIGGAINAGAGNDIVLINGKITGGSVSLGADADKMTITGGMSGGTINAGAGADIVQIAGSVSGTSNIMLGDINENDDDTLYITGSISDNTVLGATDPIINTGGGNDTVTVGGGMTGGTVSLGTGDDEMTIAGGMSGGTINADSGNDIVIIGAGMTGGTVSLGTGDDKMTITGGISGGTVNAGAGVDIVQITGNVSGNSTITLGEFNENDKDTLYITGSILDNTVVGATDPIIETGGGDDVVTVGGGMTGGTATLGTGNDVMIVAGALSGGAINTGAGNDMIAVGGGMTGGAISGGIGDNLVTVTGDMTGGSITTGGSSSDPGKDVIHITGTITGTLVNGNETTTITTNGGKDILVAGAIEGGRISMGAGDDLLIIETGGMSGGSANLGAGDNEVKITGGMSGTGTITTGDGSDTITIFTGNMTGGFIDANGGADTIKIIGSMTGGIIDAGEGDDSIAVESSMTGGIIDAGTGNDKIDLTGTNFINAVVNGGDGIDTLTLTGAGVGLSLDKIPKLSDIEVIDIGNQAFTLGAGEENLLDNSQKVSIQITSWEQLTIEAGWVHTGDGVYTKNGYTVSFVGADGTSSAGITGTIPPVTVAETPVETITVLPSSITKDAEMAEEQNRVSAVQIAQVVALATAGVVEPFIAEATTPSAPAVSSEDILDVHYPLLPETSEVVLDLSTTGVKEVDTIVEGSTAIPVVLDVETIDINKENVVESVDKVNADTVDNVENTESATESSALADAVAPVTPVAVLATKATEGVELVEENVEIVEEGEEKVEVEQEAEMIEKPALGLEDIIAEAGTLDLPREEVEASLGIYGTAEANDWYTMSLELDTEGAVAFSAPLGTLGVVNTQVLENEAFPTIDGTIIAFEFQPPSMEMQYDEQIF